MFISILSFIKALTLDFLIGDQTRGETPMVVVVVFFLISTVPIAFAQTKLNSG